MSQKSIGGRSHGSYSSESKCHDCGSSGHRTRDYHSKESYRGPSPCNNAGNKKYSPLRRRNRSKSPLSQNQYADGHSPLRRRIRSRSLVSNNRYTNHSPRKMLAQSGSPKSDHSKSPLSVQNNIHEDSLTREEHD
ncbi:hypothetical protein DsansV1_C35g0231491 [Dioscorea sansibarensis]